MSDNEQLSFDLGPAGERRDDGIEKIEESNPYIEAVLGRRPPNDVVDLLLENEPADTAVSGWRQHEDGTSDYRTALEYLEDALAKSGSGTGEASRLHRLNAINKDASSRIGALKSGDMRTLTQMARYRDHEGRIAELSEDEACYIAERIITHEDDEPFVHGFDVLIEGISNSMKDASGQITPEGKDLIARAFEAVQPAEQPEYQLDANEVGLVAEAVDAVMSYRYHWWGTRQSELDHAKTELLTR